MSEVMKAVLLMPPHLWTNTEIGVRQRHAVYCEAWEEIDRLTKILDIINDGSRSCACLTTEVAVNVHLWELPRCDGRNGTLLEAANKAMELPR